MTIQDTAIEKLRHLPGPLAQRVNDFIDLLLNQWAKLPQSRSHQTPLTPPLTALAPDPQTAWDSAMAQIANPNPDQHAAVTHLFVTWATENDAAEQQQTLQWLTQALDDDRLSDRLFTHTVPEQPWHPPKLSECGDPKSLRSAVYSPLQAENQTATLLQQFANLDEPAVAPGDLTHY